MRTRGGRAWLCCACLTPPLSWTAGGAEWLASTVFALVVLASSDMASYRDTRRLATLNPLAIGLAVFLAHLALIPIDGCSINPARTFGTSVVTGSWTLCVIVG